MLLLLPKFPVNFIRQSDRSLSVGCRFFFLLVKVLPHQPHLVLISHACTLSVPEAVPPATLLRIPSSSVTTTPCPSCLSSLQPSSSSQGQSTRKGGGKGRRVCFCRQQSNCESGTHPEDPDLSFQGAICSPCTISDIVHQCLQRRHWEAGTVVSEASSSQGPVTYSFF